MKTKWILLPVLLGILTATSTFAQDFKDKKEQLKKERKDFINRWCGFSETESSKFWQLHDEMEEKLFTLKKESKTEMRNIQDKGIDNVSEVDLKKAMERVHTSEEKQVALRWEYTQKFIDAVGVRKTARFFEGQKMFRRTLLERVRDHRMDGGGGGMDDDGDDR